MDIRDMIRLLQEEMELLETALDEAAEQLSKMLGVYVVDELRPITAYCSSLRSRIRELEAGLPIHDMERKEELIEHWREVYDTYPIPEDQNKRRHWPW